MRKYSLSKVTKIIVNNVAIIIASMVIFGGLMAIQAQRSKHTTYTAERSMMVASQYDKATIDKQVQADLNLMSSYKQIAKSDDVSKLAYKNLSNKLKKQYSFSDIKNMITVANVDQTLVLKVKATSDSPKVATIVANQAAEAVKYELPKISSNGGEVKLFSPAKVNDVESRTTPSTKKKLVIGLAVGLLVGIVISFTYTTWKEVM
ncbi:YveK family protein [Limosilactobacillus equigenerosi]|uniref:YveK family protein n=1 Tax=Limosilactobacillus equigenerosi TaxID=417373 RepID=UPI0007053E0C|nr:hypothetical protein [Limosilactobacillus equigenerosi]